jgi:hypothetical protein
MSCTVAADALRVDMRVHPNGDGLSHPGPLSCCRVTAAQRPAKVPVDPDPRLWVSVGFELPARDVAVRERAA